MISDDERRFVCENLRQCAENPQFPEYMEQFMFDLCIILFGLSKEKHRHSEIFSRLADLIEPSCDRDALLELADEMTVEKGDIWGWSRRIREALGGGER